MNESWTTRYCDLSKPHPKNNPSIRHFCYQPLLHRACSAFRFSNKDNIWYVETSNISMYNGTLPNIALARLAAMKEVGPGKRLCQGREKKSKPRELKINPDSFDNQVRWHSLKPFVSSYTTRGLSTSLPKQWRHFCRNWWESLGCTISCLLSLFSSALLTWRQNKYTTINSLATAARTFWSAGYFWSLLYGHFITLQEESLVWVPVPAYTFHTSFAVSNMVV